MAIFLQHTHKLYDEVRRKGAGRKAAPPNIGLQVGLSRQGISTTGLADILQVTNTPALSTRGIANDCKQGKPGNRAG